MVDLHAVQVAVVRKGRLVAGIVVAAALRARARIVAVEAHVVVERERRVGAVHLVRAGPLDVCTEPVYRHRPTGIYATDAAAAEDVRLHAHHGEVRRERFRVRLVPGLDVDGADAQPAHLAGQPAAGPDRHRLALLQADPAAEEHQRRVVAAAPTGRPFGTAAGRTAAHTEHVGTGPEIEGAARFEEELAFFRKEQVEPRQVHLRLIHLHLREVGVDGEVGGQVLRHSPLQVHARGAVAAVRVRLVGRQVGGQRTDAVRLHLQPRVPRRRLQADQRGGHRQAEHAGPGRDRDRREVGSLVLAAHAPAELEAPHL